MRSRRVSISVMWLLFLGLAGCTSELDGGAQQAATDENAVAQAELRLLGSGALRDWLRERRERRVERWLSYLCTRSDGSYNCACNRIWNPDDVDCSGTGGVDECAEGTDDCGDDAVADAADSAH